MQCSRQEILDIINKYDYIAITGHVQPDGDCLGSMIALYLYLVQQNKHPVMLLDDDIPALYGFVPLIELINKPLPEHASVQLLVVLDASDIDRIGELRNILKCPIVNIDHHPSNTQFADYWYFDFQATATGQIIFEILQMTKAKITPDMATCLFMAIATDCGFFRYSNTSSAAMHITAELIDSGANPNFISDALQTKHKDSIALLSRILQTLEFSANGRIAAITIDMQQKSTLDTEGYIDYPRYIEGVEVALMFKIINATTTRISLRSKHIDVSAIALSFGGGGHVRAAGCTIYKDVTLAKTLLLTLLKQAIGVQL